MINLVNYMNPDYNLYVRQYSYNDNETIFQFKASAQMQHI